MCKYAFSYKWVNSSLLRNDAVGISIWNTETRCFCAQRFNVLCSLTCYTAQISDVLYVQVTVHRDNLRINNQQDAPSIQNFILSRNSTCFGHLLCSSSRVISCTRGNWYVSCRLCGRCLGESGCSNPKHVVSWQDTILDTWCTLLVIYTKLRVCTGSLRYPACKAHAPYCHLWPAPLYNTFPHYLINGTTFGGEKKVTEPKMWVLIFCSTVLWSISHSKKKWEI
jgi:hypothetical protein